MKTFRLTAALAASCLVLTLLAGCENSIEPTVSTPSDAATTTPAPNIVPSTPPQSDIPGDKPAQTGRDITIYEVVENSEGDRSLKPKTVPLSADFKQTPALFALEELMNTDHSPIPEGTVLKSVKIGADGVATADFSKAFQENFPGGDSAEALTINALLATLGQFKSVKSVQILVEGEKIDSLGGNQSLTEPLPVPQSETAHKDDGG